MTDWFPRRRYTADVLVVGAGAAGCATAYTLSRAGYKVVLAGGSGIASDASGNAWGGLTAHFGVGVPGPMLERYRRSTQMHLELYDELKPELPPELDWQLQPVTSLKLAMNESELAELRGESDWKSANGFDAQIVDGDEARKIEPAITDDAIGGMMTNTEWELDCVRYSNALVHATQLNGGQYIREFVLAIEREGDSIVGYTDCSSAIDTDAVVLATGPFVNSIGVQVDSESDLAPLPIHAVKGEILRVERPGNDLQARVGYNGLNVGRKPDGLVWLGTYERNVGIDFDITDEGRHLIRSSVVRYLPSLANAMLQLQTACMRPSTADGLPLVGEVAPGVYSANGGGKKGILMSLYLGELTLDAIQNAGREIPPEYSPHRFGPLLEPR